MKLSFRILIGFLAINATAFGQDQVKDILKGSKEDINFLANGYLTPALKAWGNGINQGWYNTAKVHKLVGFDITVVGSLMAVPETDKLFAVDNSKLKNISLINSSGVANNGNVPTFVGSDAVAAPQYQYKTSTGVLVPNTKFEGPKGVTNGSIAVPMVQLGIGLPKGFELKLRYIPETDLKSIASGLNNKTLVSMFGIGVMHDIKQYIPAVSQLPFDLSAFVGYTKYNLEVNLDNSKPNNKAIYEGSATTIQGLISKKFAVITFYGSVGYNFASTSANIKGSYNTGNDPITGQPILITDPVSVSVSTSGPRVTAGMRLKLAIFTLHGDYTLQDYSAITAGLGISIR
jgi:hypothetical protein